MIESALRARLAVAGGELEPLVCQLLTWATRAGPLLAEYRAAATDLPESAGNPAWLEELPEAARAMGLALGAARLLQDVAAVDEESAGWDFVEHLLGAAETARLHHAGQPLPGSADAVPQVAPPEVAGEPPEGVAPPEGGEPVGPVLVGAHQGPVAAPGRTAEIEVRLAELETEQRRLTGLIEAMALSLGAAAHVALGAEREPPASGLVGIVPAPVRNPFAA